ncbi:MAG TPA: hypothetical protein DCS13_13475 [Candidatus Margulisbacteria bacterium]|nr:hypothetical protein [Candidatus Margulisiibacteriota bacterium]
MAMKPLNLRFRDKLLLAVIPLIIISLSTLGAVMYYSTSKIIGIQQKESMNQSLYKIAEEIEQWMKSVEQQSEVYSITDVLINACKGIDTEGAQRSLTKYNRIMNIYENIFLANMNGKILIDSIGGKSVGLEIAKIPFYEKNIQKAKEGKPWITDVGKSPATGMPIVFMSRPIYMEGSLAGILGTPVQLETFSDTFISGIKLGETGIIYIVDKTGTTIAHPNKEQIFKLNISDYDYGKKILTQKNGELHYELEGKQMVAFLKHIEKRDWIVVAAIPENEIYATLSKAKQICLVSVLAFIIITTIIIWLFSEKLIKPIKKTSSVLKDLLEGERDFSRRIEKTSNDEFGEMCQYVNNFFDSMQNIMKNVKLHAIKVQDFSKTLAHIAQETAKGINQISTALDGVAKGTSDQTTSIGEAIYKTRTLLDMINNIAKGAQEQNENISKSMEISRQNSDAMSQINETSTKQLDSADKVMNVSSQMTKAVDQIASDASRTAENSKQTRDIALNGENIVTQTVIGMGRISEKVLSAADKINELGKNSTKIGEIVNVIDDISEQTNLLALNAAIEAARAGDHGRGFAVVADEVRKLAEKSSRATKEIATLIKSIQESTDIAVIFMKESTDEVRSGSGLVNQAKSALTTIIDAVKDTVNQIENISAFTEEMSASACENVANMHKLTQLTEITDGAVKEVSVSSNVIFDSFAVVSKVAKLNVSITNDMKHGMDEFIGLINDISNVATDNSSSTQEITASSEQISASINSLKDSSEEMVNLSNELYDNIAQFKLD